MVVYCIVIAPAGERQCAEVEGMDVGLDSKAEADIEAAVAAAQDRCFVSGSDNTHSCWRQDSRSIVHVPREGVFAPLLTIFELLRKMKRSCSASAQQAAGTRCWSSSETFPAVEKLRIYSKRPHPFDTKMHDRNCSDGYSYPAGSHNLPCLTKQS